MPDIAELAAYPQLAWKRHTKLTLILNIDSPLMSTDKRYGLHKPYGMIIYLLTPYCLRWLTMLITTYE